MMNQPNNELTKDSKKIGLIITIIIITAIIIGIGVFLWQRWESRKSIIKLQSEKAKLQNRLNDLEDKERTWQEFGDIFPMIEKKLPDWFQNWQTVILGFNINSFTWQEATTITSEMTPFNPNDTIAKLRKPFYIYSPDKSKFLDIYIGMELWEESGKIKAGYGPDHAVSLVDLKTNQLKILLFIGTAGNYDDALWLDNDRFIVTGFTEYLPKSKEERKLLGDKTYYAALLYYFNLNKNKMTLYYGPKVEGTLFRMTYLKFMRDRFRNKFPNIIFE